ncbi:MAG: ADP-ribosylglycohydrolase family protein [Chloroflexota bacterium]
MTTLKSIENLISGQSWEQATDVRSKGCGATMRVQPVGLLPIDSEQRAAIAQLQAALTHGHPTALAAADLTAWFIAELLQNSDLNTLLKRSRDYIMHQQTHYHETWLGILYQRALMFPTGSQFIQRGWMECLTMIDRVEDALSQKTTNVDPAVLIGEGWVAEECLGVALYCLLRHPTNPLEAIQHAAFTRGDSDTTACLTGALVGAHHGIVGLPESWVERLEYKSQLRHVAQGIAEMWGD